ncbi:ABC transporter ATP-binding protein (plasmid) [Haloimpatiens sp. FM7330]|uniref:ABC transporter ATP-binding protein n=1 Tax=Haloimpatiens sp. FM7330 TaxID=3298610 RepID=UPI00363D2BFB
MNILKTRSLCKTYGKDTAKVQALKSIDLEISKGEFVAIIGPSGSGKSTLLHLLGGLDKPSSGEVTLNGKNIYKLSENKLSDIRRKEFGFIFQSFNLIPVLTGEENILLPLSVDNTKVDNSYIKEIITTLGIKDRIKHYPNELSGGQQQRIAIARALAVKPSVIFADEPTGNLDSKTTEDVLRILRYSVKKFNATLVMITHDEKVASCADRIITIVDGQIVKDEKNTSSNAKDEIAGSKEVSLK